MSYSGNVLTPTNNLSFSNLNLITNSTTAQVGGSTILYIPAKTGDNLTAQYVAAPATPYCLIANVVCNQGDYNTNNNTNTIVYGIGFTDLTKSVLLAMDWNNTTSSRMAVYNFPTVTSVGVLAGNNSMASGQPTSLVNWFQIRDDGTNIYFYIALDGMEGAPPTMWVKLYQESRTAHLASPSNIFWGADSNGTGAATFLTLNSWQTVPL